MKKQILFKDEAREQLLEGAKLLYDAVSTTLGPKGQNAVIEAFGEPVVTHDGVTVAKAIEVASENRPGVRVGVEMIKSSSSQTNDKVGDGTTSSTILAYHLINEGNKLIKTGTNPMVLRKQLESAKDKALNILSKLKEDIKTEQQAIEVATISSENSEIGKNVGKMYYKLGKDAIVSVEIGTGVDTKYEITEGYAFDRGMYSPIMVNDTATQTAQLVNPVVIIAYQTVSFEDIEELLLQLWQAGEDTFLVIANGFKNDFIDAAITLRDKFHIVGVKSPGFGDQRPELLKDLAALTGATVLGDTFARKVHEITADDIGRCKKVIVTEKETVITGGKDVSEHINTLKVKLKSLTGEYDREKLKKRIAQLESKIGQIKVGGHTEMEAEERKYLIDDAVAATEAALKEGIVPGGATTYTEIAKQMSVSTGGERILYEALLAPFKVLMTNSGERFGPKLEELTEYGKGFDVMTDEGLVDLKEHGIIDPVMVIKQAIQNAVSVAGSVLTTGVLITNEKEKDEEEE